jgi:hypothetical protein
VGISASTNVAAWIAQDGKMHKTGAIEPAGPSAVVIADCRLPKMSAIEFIRKPPPLRFRSTRPVLEAGTRSETSLKEAD